MIKKMFVCNNIEKAKELGFNRVSEYSSKRVYSHKENRNIKIDYYAPHQIKIISHNYNSYALFKELVEAGIVEETTVETFSKDKQIELLNERINALEEQLRKGE